MRTDEVEDCVVEPTRLSLSQSDYAIVRQILAEELPGRTVWAFGSRASQSKLLRKYSDLDLAVKGHLSISEHGTLADRFDESMLTIKVDILGTADVDARFRSRIEQDFVPLQIGTEEVF